MMRRNHRLVPGARDQVSRPSSQHMPDPSLSGKIAQLGLGYMSAACIYVAAKLGIADLLAGGPKPTSELARAAKVKEGELYRVLRAMASIEVFREMAPQTFVNTPLSEMLRSDLPGSARDAVLFLSDPLHLRSFAELMHTVETGESAFKKVTGMEATDFFRQKDDENRAFNAAMTAISANAAPAIEGYDFGESGTLADIGGGHGMLMAMILASIAGFAESFSTCRMWSRARSRGSSRSGWHRDARSWAAISSRACLRRTATS